MVGRRGNAFHEIDTLVKTSRVIRLRDAKPTSQYSRNLTPSFNAAPVGNGSRLETGVRPTDAAGINVAEGDGKVRTARSRARREA